MTEWPFDLWLKYAVKVLRLSPTQFWAMSVSDWFALILKTDGQGLKRVHMDALMKLYPDEKHDGDTR